MIKSGMVKHESLNLRILKIIIIVTAMLNHLVSCRSRILSVILRIKFTISHLGTVWPGLAHSSFLSSAGFSRSSAPPSLSSLDSSL